MSTSARRFAFGRCLGRGSFGEVYQATMRSPGGLESPVAVKLLRADIDLRGEAVRRLRDEGRLLARLNHPAILKVFDLVTLRGRLALITELVDGQDLAECLPGRGPDPDGAIALRPLVQALSQVAGALDAAATTPGPEGPLRLVHRDLKPRNIRIDRHGQAKLLDFGIARFDASDREVRTASDLVVGSVPYMAPERFVKRGVDPSSDVFSLGCTMYEGITGKRFYGSSNVAKITGLALQPEVYVDWVADRVASLSAPAGVKELLEELVRIDPERRPTAGAVAARLEELADALGGPTLRMWCRGRSWDGGPELEGPMQGEVVVEGELEAFEPAPPGRGPVIHRQALATMEPGQSFTDLENRPTEPGSEDAVPRIPPANPTLAPPTAAHPAPTEEAPLAPRPPGNDSVWDRPYTEEDRVPAPVPPPAGPDRPAVPPAPALPTRRRAPWLLLVAAIVLLLALVGVAILTLLAIPGLWLTLG